MESVAHWSDGRKTSMQKKNEKQKSKQIDLKHTNTNSMKDKHWMEHTRVGRLHKKTKVKGKKMIWLGKQIELHFTSNEQRRENKNKKHFNAHDPGWRHRQFVVRGGKRKRKKEHTINLKLIRFDWKVQTGVCGHAIESAASRMSDQLKVGTANAIKRKQLDHKRTWHVMRISVNRQMKH